MHKDSMGVRVNQVFKEFKVSKDSLVSKVSKAYRDYMVSGVSRVCRVLKEFKVCRVPKVSRVCRVDYRLRFEFGQLIVVGNNILEIIPTNNTSSYGMDLIYLQEWHGISTFGVIIQVMNWLLQKWLIEIRILAE